MKLRARLDLFSAALLSALGASPIACGGSTTSTVENGGGSSGTGSASGSGQSGSGHSGSSSAGSGQSGSGHSGSGQSGSGQSGSGHSGSSSAGSGQSGAATAGAAGSAGASSSSNQFPCNNPRDIGGGLIECDGFKHRKTVVTCVSHVPRPDAIPVPGTGGVCMVDTDCTEKPYGWCGPGVQLPGGYCSYGCINDSECGANQLCECGEPVGACVSADCSSDADCASGFLCKAYDRSGGCGLTSYTCQSAGDACGSDADCAPMTGFSHCRFDTAKQSFQCVQGSCAIGRPFLVEDKQRLAPPAARADWSELALLPRLAGLDATLRAELAEQWTRVALMEHASIAAFARFTLQLMSVGAPAELIERATAAMIDETKHAKACFAIASGCANRPLGPGSLAIEHSLDQSSLQEVVLNTIREGCVGETVAAIEAREAAEHACDPALRELLLRISEDETRHAELAYRFLQWAVTTGGPELERAARREFDALATEAAPAASALTPSERSLLEHGVLPDALRTAIRRQAIAQVILPCSRALTAPAADASGALPGIQPSAESTRSSAS